MAGHLCDTTWQQTKHLHQVVWWTFAWIYWGRFQVSNQHIFNCHGDTKYKEGKLLFMRATWPEPTAGVHPHFIHYDVQFRHFMVRKEEGETWNRRAFCVAGVALGDIDRHFAWQAYGTGLALVARWPRLAPWSPWLFAWQAWRLATSTFTLRGRRGTWRHRRAFCMASIALVALGCEDGVLAQLHWNLMSSPH